MVMAAGYREDVRASMKQTLSRSDVRMVFLRGVVTIWLGSVVNIAKTSSECNDFGKLFIICLPFT
jgi:hypothetical protein